MVKDSSGNCVVSIRCRARRTAELVRARIPSRGGITTPSEFLFAVVRDVQRNRHIPGAWWCLAKFLFAVVRDVQRNWSRRQHFAGVDPLRVSIRCRARRTAEHWHWPIGTPTGSFYSLSCETYSGTMTSSPGGSRTPFSSSFYSLSCETYSGTRLGPRAGLVFVRRVGLLFAVVRDVQRNHHRWFVGRLPGHGFYSLRARRTAELVALQHATSHRSTFLFAVVRDVQRNTVLSLGWRPTT